MAATYSAALHEVQLKRLVNVERSIQDLGAELDRLIVIYTQLANSGEHADFADSAIATKEQTQAYLAMLIGFRDDLRSEQKQAIRAPFSTADV